MQAIIRPALSSDVDPIYKLLLPYSEDGIILRRTHDEILHALDRFFVAVRGADLIGLISFCDYGERLKEVRSLAVDRSSYKKGVGSMLLKHLIDHLRTHSAEARIFALSYSPEFFIKQGFVEVSKESLPEKIWKDCDNCVNRNDCHETALVYKER